MKRLRAIWREGTFAALKREHNLKRARKRGLNRMSEECLLSALALNLKRIVKAAGEPALSVQVNYNILYISLLPRASSNQNSYFVNRSNLGQTLSIIL